MRRATESPLRMRPLTSPTEGNLVKTLFKLRLGLALLLLRAALMTPAWRALLLTTFEDAAEITPKSALGKFPSRGLPLRTLDWPVVVEVMRTAPVPTLPRPPAPEPNWAPKPVPSEVAARSETPVSWVFPPPTDTAGMKVLRLPLSDKLEPDV